MRSSATIYAGGDAGDAEAYRVENQVLFSEPAVEPAIRGRAIGPDIYVCEAFGRASPPDAPIPRWGSEMKRRDQNERKENARAAAGDRHGGHAALRLFDEGGGGAAAAPSAAPADEVPADKTEAVAPGEEKQLKIGFSIITLTFPYYVKMLDGFEAACKEKGWDYVYTDAGMDVEKTVNDCLDLTLKDIDALVIASLYGDSLQDVFEQCKAANIPVFLIDTGSLPPDGDYVTNIGTVDFDAGYNGGYWAAGQMKEAGKEAVRMISFTTATSNGRNRADGFVKGLEEGGLTVEVLNEYLGDSRESYMTPCEDALVTYPGT